MTEAIKELLTLITDKFGAIGGLLLALCGLGIYSWFQHHRAQILQQRIELEAERRRTEEERRKVATEEVLAMQKRLDAAPDLTAHKRPLDLINRTIRVLVVEDDDSQREMWKLFLEERGIAVQTAEDGVEGLEKQKEFRPHVMLLDLMMPRMTGWEVMQILWENNVKQQTIVSTGYSAEKAKVMALKMAEVGQVSFTAKPVTVENMLNEILLHYQRAEAASSATSVAPRNSKPD